jgi:tetratricopeptide (TPR) repeat protein
MVSLTKILNADLHEIVAMHLSREERSTFGGFYVSLLKHYLTNDVTALEKLLARIESGKSADAATKFKLSDGDTRILSALGRARLASRRGNVSETELAALLETMPDEGALRGEFFYVLALCFESLNRVREMSDAYLAASQELRKCGVHSKAVKALFNHISAEHRLHPTKKFLSEFQFCYREAKKHKVHSTAAMALVNISREYQLIGGFELALRNVNRAILLLDRQRYARSYYLALAHRAHVLLVMGRKEEALEDFREAQLCTFPDVSTALETLKDIFSGNQEPSVKPALESWEGRVAEANQGKQKLGPLEQRLLKFLSETPRTRWELIEFLYGGTLAPEVLENRLNNTLQRIKKKLPGLIVNDGGRYRLAEALVDTRLKRNA